MTRTWIGFLTASVLASALLACGPKRNEAVEQSKEQFMKSTEEQMQALQEEMTNLKNEVDDMAEAARNEIKPRIESWERQYENLEERLESTKVVTLAELRSFESEVNTILGNLRATYNDLAADLRAALS